MLRAETMMYEPLVDFFKKRGLLVLREVTTHEGRADLVAARIDWSAARLRQRLGFTRGLTRTPLLRAWNALPQQGTVTIDFLSEALAVSPGSARALVRELEGLGFVNRVPEGYKKRGTLPAVVTEVICCEAKLDDWKRGLSQAYGHRFYADQSYLALANRIPRTLDLDLLDERQVGLVSVADIVSEERSALPRCPPPSRARSQIEERFWVEIVEPSLRIHACKLTREVRRATA